MHWLYTWSGMTVNIHTLLTDMTHDACMRRHAILLLLLQTCGKLLKENFWKKRTLIIRLEMWHYSAVAWMKAPPVTCKPQGGRVEPWLCEWVLCEAKAVVCCCCLLLYALLCCLSIGSLFIDHIMLYPWCICNARHVKEWSSPCSV